jgi:hypothetical protein
MKAIAVECWAGSFPENMLTPPASLALVSHQKTKVTINLQPITRWSDL